MSSCPRKFKNEQVVFFLVNQKPVRTDMQLTVSFPVAFKIVIVVAFIKNFII